MALIFSLSGQAQVKKNEMAKKQRPTAQSSTSAGTHEKKKHNNKYKRRAKQIHDRKSSARLSLLAYFCAHNILPFIIFVIHNSFLFINFCAFAFISAGFLYARSIERSISFCPVLHWSMCALHFQARLLHIFAFIY